MSPITIYSALLTKSNIDIIVEALNELHDGLQYNDEESAEDRAEQAQQIIDARAAVTKALNV
jgi:hypothetical protein